MFALTSNITIGNFINVKPNNVNIKKSIYDYVDKAIIKLPASARLHLENKDEVVSAETAKQFNEGDAVVINLGYNGDNNIEFEGFISRVNFTQPVEVECEGYSYLLRKRTYLKTFVKAELKEVLQYLVNGTGIQLDKNIPGFLIDKIVLQNNSGTEALEIIKKISDNQVSIFFTGNILYAGLIYMQTDALTYKAKAITNYKLGWNVIKDGNLKQRVSKNDDVTVNYIGEKKDGSKVKCVGKSGKSTTKANVITSTASSGASGEIKVRKSHAVTDVNALQNMANSYHYKLTYDGYEGKITAFLQPYCEPGYTAALTDDKFPERSGSYFIDSIEINYGMQGARRIVGIAFKLN